MAVMSQCNSKSFFILLLLMTFCGIIVLHQQDFFQQLFTFRHNIYSLIWNQTHNHLKLTSHTLPSENNQWWTFRTSDAPTATPSTNELEVLTTERGVLDHEAYPHNYQFIIDEPDKCQQENPFLVLMVPVAPQQLKARDAIRSTWGNESLVQGKSISMVFVLGLYGGKGAEKMQEELRTESEQHHDLIQSSFLDSYRNLTIKTMVMMDWLATRCPQASYAMKIDSDMFLNLENLMSLLLAPDTPKMNYITGMVMSNRMVVRNIHSKWYVSKEDHPDDQYPTYLLGMGYVFSNNLPERLVRVSKFIKPFPIEDAYVGACLKELGVSPSSPPEPSRFKAYHRGPFNRDTFTWVITTILSSPEQLVMYWQNLKNPKLM
ncbi:beta-1,3-galactosyltransferase 2-like [Trichomycterus rosablanca]|uniref:beta-1,3-galactosyltransferase 2-like n=1 Tax=Trichomycterus rosablanca TaxID=2290929 RepID=UPI002F35F529